MSFCRIQLILLTADKSKCVNFSEPGLNINDGFPDGSNILQTMKDEFS